MERCTPTQPRVNWVSETMRDDECNHKHAEKDEYRQSKSACDVRAYLQKLFPTLLGYRLLRLENSDLEFLGAKKSRALP